MVFGSKFAAGLGLIAAMGLIVPALAQTGPGSMGSGAPMQPGTSQPSSTGAMPSDNGPSMRSNGASSMQSNSGSSAMSAPSATQADASKLSKDQISAVQQALNVRSDGVWGPETQSALKKYQQQSGLPATGQLDQATRAKLNVPG